MSHLPPMRRTRDRPHARVYHYWLNLPAWATMSVHAKCLLIELLARYRPDEPNSFPLPNAEAARWLACAPNTAARAIAELTERGWIVIERRGTMRGSRSARCRVVSLAAYPSDTRVACMDDVLRWRADG